MNMNDITAIVAFISGICVFIGRHGIDMTWMPFNRSVIVEKFRGMLRVFKNVLIILTIFPFLNAHAEDKLVTLFSDPHMNAYFYADSIERKGDIVSYWQRWEINDGTEPNYDMAAAQSQSNCRDHTSIILAVTGYRKGNNQGYPVSMNGLGVWKGSVPGSLGAMINNKVCVASDSAWDRFKRKLTH